MQMDTLTKYIHSLTALVAPSGFESKVINVWKQLIEPYVDSFAETPMGDGVAILNGNDEGSVMIVAHADEIGLIISRIDKEKKIAFFDEIGGIDTKLLVGRSVEFFNSDGQSIKGIIGCQPIHCQNRLQNQNNTQLEPSDLWIDFGDNIENITIGDYGVISQPCVKIGNIISGRAMDDRVGLAVMIDVARKLQGHHLNKKVYFVASTMEEIGARGVRAVVNRLAPSLCLVIDVAIATDTPFHNLANKSTVNLGDGAVVTIGPNIDNAISCKIQSIARQNSLSIQLEVIAGPTGTDANPVQISRDGIPCGLIGIPCRYMHSPVESVNILDITVATDLIYHYLLTL